MRFTADSLFQSQSLSEQDVQKLISTRLFFSVVTQVLTTFIVVLNLSSEFFQSVLSFWLNVM